MTDPNAIARFKSIGYAVSRATGCHLWLGGTRWMGYGSFAVSAAEPRKFTGAHRFSYELAHGNIPEGHELDHLCRNPLCINPQHLEPVTRSENLKRGIIGMGKQFCPSGHPYAGENLKIGSKGENICRTCYIKNNRTYRKRKRNG